MDWDLDSAIEHLQAFAQRGSTGRCARFVREAIEAGGLILPRTTFAKNYGFSLLAAGFREVPLRQFISAALLSIVFSHLSPFQKGDVVIFTEGSPAGHMQMFDGTTWISDFVQRDFCPGPKFEDAAYQLYRHPGILQDGILSTALARAA